MARPIQLRYDDVNDGETVIGTYLTDDNLIQQASMKNSGSGEYTRLEIKGSRQLKDNLPIDYTQYNTSEPDILVYVLNDSGNWELRDRVFAEDAGTIDDKGNYRNDKLWGFQKWVGRKKTPNQVSLTNATITDIMDQLLPSGYTAQTPSDDTVPTVDNYSFNGKIDRAIRDLVRDFPVKIWFSPETDGSGNYIVKVQSKGYGDIVQTITFDSERQTEGYQINQFEEEDKSNIINKVEIEGTDPDGNLVNVVVPSTSYPNQTAEDSINEHGERYIYRHVGYLGQNAETQAEQLANDILNPQPSPHANMSIPFQDDNILNASIDILDERYGIDAVYTVVKQRDFFTEGRTEVELGFEKNRSEERRDRDRDLDEQNHRLFPSAGQDVQFDIDEENTYAQGPDKSAGESYDDQIDNEQSHDVGGTASETGQVEMGVLQTSSDTNFTLSDGGSNTVSTTINYSGNIAQILVLFESDATSADKIVVEVSGSTFVDPFIELTTFPSTSGKIAFSHLETDANLSGETLDFTVGNISGGDITVDNHEIRAVGEDPHDHQIGQEPDRALGRLTGVENEVDDLFEQLDVLGQTVQKVIDTLDELKSDR